MTESAKTLSVEARKLSPAERIDLVEEINRTRKGRSLRGIKVKDLIHEGHKC